MATPSSPPAAMAGALRRTATLLIGLPAEIIELRPTDSFRLILAAMGAAQPALDRVDADRLEQALSRLASA